MPRDRADVVVIGSGAAGAAVAWRLASRGARVVCLEQGDWLRPGDFASEQHEFEASVRRGRHALLPNDRKREEDYPVTTGGDGPCNIVMWNGVGGSTVHWEGHFPRLHPSDFAVRRLDDVAEDWPISYADLEPFYDANDRMIGVSGLAGDPANPPRAPRSTPPMPLGRSGEALVRGFEALGWHWWPSDNAIISRDYDGRTGCDNRGRCNFGCPLKAKASADVVYWPKALVAGATLTVRARVSEILVGDDGRVTGVGYFDRRGDRQIQPARVVVVCCNGIGTPRLLLASKSARFPDGLANSNGQVGRRLMNHPSRFVEGIFDEPFEKEAFSGNPFFSQEFYETDRGRGFVRGYSLLVYRPLGPASVAWGDSEPVPWNYLCGTKIVRKSYSGLHNLRLLLAGCETEKIDQGRRSNAEVVTLAAPRAFGRQMQVDTREAAFLVQRSRQVRAEERVVEGPEANARLQLISSRERGDQIGLHARR